LALLSFSAIIDYQNKWLLRTDNGCKTPWFQWCLTPYNDSLFTQTLNNTSKCNLQGDWKRVNILNHVCWSHLQCRKHPIFSLPTFDMTPKLQNLSHVPKFNFKKIMITKLAPTINDDCETRRCINMIVMDTFVFTINNIIFDIRPSKDAHCLLHIHHN
jgi:hypothetical protein